MAVNVETLDKLERKMTLTLPVTVIQSVDPVTGAVIRTPVPVLVQSVASHPPCLITNP